LLSIIDSLSEWSGKTFSFLLVVATLVVVFEVVMRYVFNAPTIWGLELTIYLCATIYVMAGAYAHWLDAHVKVDVLYMRWSLRTKAIVDSVLTGPLFLFFCGVLVWQSGEWTWVAITRGFTSGTMWAPPLWPMRLVLFLGSSLLLLQGLAKFVRDLITATKGRAEV